MLKYCVWCALTRATPRSRAQTSSHVRVGTPWWRVGRRGETREGSRITIITSYLGTMILYIMIRDNPCVTTILQACDSFSNGMRVSATYFTCIYKFLLMYLSSHCMHWHTSLLRVVWCVR